MSKRKPRERLWGVGQGFLWMIGRGGKGLASHLVHSTPPSRENLFNVDHPPGLAPRLSLPADRIMVVHRDEIGSLRAYAAAAGYTLKRGAVRHSFRIRGPDGQVVANQKRGTMSFNAREAKAFLGSPIDPIDQRRKTFLVCRMPEHPPPRKAYRPPAESIPTLGELHRGEFKWWWAYCTARGCAGTAAITLTWAVIRWGPDASSDLLRQRLVCSRCGHRGATLRTPSWSGEQRDWATLAPVSPRP